MFVIILNYQKPLDIVDQHLIAHRNYLEEAYKKNQLIASGPQNPRTGGVLISQLTNKDELMEIIRKDPFYINEVANYNVIEFTPVKYHKDFTCFIE